MNIVAASKRPLGRDGRASYDFDRMFKRFNIDKRSNVARYRRPETYEDVVTTHHVYHVQPIIMREQVHTTIRHVVQPVLESEEVTEKHQVGRVQEFRPVQYDEYIHDISEEHKQKISDNRRRVAEAGSRIEMPDTHEEVYEEPQVHETVVERVKEEIQPVLKRNIRKTKVMHEVVPKVEVHERITAVEDVTENKPIAFDEYLKWSSE